MKKKRVVIVDGVRTPYIKAWTLFDNLSASELGCIAVRELLERLDLDPAVVNEVIIGNVGQPADSANIARVISLKAGIPREAPAYTVQRNCASGMQAVINAYRQIILGESGVIIAGGVESMSNIPFFYSKSLQGIIQAFQRAKSLPARIKVLSSLRPAHFRPVIGLLLGLTDPVCGLNMGQTAEVLAREFGISREDQDAFSLVSHQRAENAIEEGRLGDEIVPVYVPPKFKGAVAQDNGVRRGQSLEALGKLKPVFDKRHGTVTAGNSSQITDGAAAVLVMSEEKAAELGYEPMGFIRSYGFAGCDPGRMGLGPVFATDLALRKAQLAFEDLDLFEINEAFAAQVLACERAISSEDFAKKHLDRKSPLGEIDRKKLNVNGGAIALGHPVGSSGTRLILTLLKEMKRRKLHLGLATLCIGGGQGGAVIVER
ncbi:MAG: thiolase family protein [Deltaproteobacteria bacterium]|nr:thiolase family protein [Deltaproteobacteria bacterium]